MFTWYSFLFNKAGGRGMVDCTGYCLVCGKDATLDRVIGEYAISLCVDHNSIPSKELYEIITDKSVDNSNIINAFEHESTDYEI